EAQLAVHALDLAAHPGLLRELDRAVDGLQLRRARAPLEGDAAVDGMRPPHGGVLAYADRAIHRGYIAGVLAGCHLDTPHDLRVAAAIAPRQACRAHAEDRERNSLTPSPLRIHVLTLGFCRSPLDCRRRAASLMRELPDESQTGRPAPPRSKVHPG